MAGTRTRDHRIKSAMLYRLSYHPIGKPERISRSIYRVKPALQWLSDIKCTGPAQDFGQQDALAQR